MTIYVYNVTHSAFKVGVFAGLTFLPRLFGTFYGILVDRYNRVNVLMWTSFLTGILVIMMVLWKSPLWIYSIWLIISVLLTVIINVRTTLMTEIVSKENYVNGNSTLLISLNVAKICAPLIAGYANIRIGINSLFFITGWVYFGVSLCCMWIRMPSFSHPSKGGRKIISELKEGIKYMITSHDMKYLISVAFLWRLFIGLQISLFVVYVKAFLAGNDADYGLFMTAVGVGSIGGSFIGPWLVKRMNHSKMINWGMSLHYVSFMLLGVIHNYFLALSVVILSYVIFYATLVGIHSIRDKTTRVDLRGRVYGSVTAILTPAAIISMLLGGYLANSFGVENVFIYAGASALVSFHLLGLTNRATQGT